MNILQLISIGYLVAVVSLCVSDQAIAQQAAESAQSVGNDAGTNANTGRQPRVTELIRTRVELKGALLAKQVDSHLKQNDLALLAVGDFLSANPSIDPAIAHSRMKRYQRAAAGLRSILSIAADGTLMHDSYSLPPPEINLGDRTYVREAVRQGTGDLRINPAVIGRHSGLPFIPITRGLFNVEGATTGVIVGIVGPETLLPDNGGCALCVSAVLTKGMDVLVSRPSGLIVPENLIRQIQDSMSYTGLEMVDIKGSPTIFAWSRNNYAGVITVFGELLPD